MLADMPGGLEFVFIASDLWIVALIGFIAALILEGLWMAKRMKRSSKKGPSGS